MQLISYILHFCCVLMVKKLLKITDIYADSIIFFHSTSLSMQPSLKKSLFEVLTAVIMNNRVL